MCWSDPFIYDHVITTVALANHLHPVSELSFFSVCTEWLRSSLSQLRDL